MGPPALRAAGRALFHRVVCVSSLLAAAVLCAPAEGAAPQASDFFAWLDEHGVEYGAKLDVGVDENTGLRGLVVKEELVANGTVLFRVPARLVLTVERAREEGAFWQQCHAGDGNSDGPDVLSPVHTAFSLFLLEQRAAGSAWQPWVASLPEDFSGLPLFYGPADLEGLQASPLRRVLGLEQGSLARDYDALASSGSTFAVEEYTWARAAVRSRVFDLSKLPAGNFDREVIAMVPLADFVNHPPEGVGENVAPAYDVSTGDFTFTARRDIGRGEGLYWDYGFKSNRHSLNHYGFVSEGRIAFTDMPLFVNLTDFPASTSGDIRAWKLGRIEAAEKEGSLFIDPDGTVLHEFALALQGRHAERLLGHMRFQVWRPRAAALLADYCRDTYCRPISSANERAALRHLAVVLEELLAAYGTTVAEDKQLLEDGGVAAGGGSTWQTLIIRYGEKQIMRGFLRLLQALDSLFDLSPSSLADAVAERWNNPASDIHRYVRQNLTALLKADTARRSKRQAKVDKAAAA